MVDRVRRDWLLSIERDLFRDGYVNKMIIFASCE